MSPIFFLISHNNIYKFCPHIQTCTNLEDSRVDIVREIRYEIHWYAYSCIKKEKIKDYISVGFWSLA